MNNDEQNQSFSEDEQQNEIENEELIQCPDCLRRMRRQVFEKHPKLCQANPNKKRTIRTFDMTKYRSVRSGDSVLPVKKVTPPSTSTSNYNITQRPSQTRSAKRDRRSDSFVPPVINNFCCPQCKRTFCEKAYDRHVAFCSSQLKKVQQPPSEEVLLARLKLDRRVKFSANRLNINTTSMTKNPAQSPVQTMTTTNNVKPIPSLPREPVRFLSMKKPMSDSLARCPWCSKPYMPNCIHYCRNSKELFSIHSK